MESDRVDRGEAATAKPSAPSTPTVSAVSPNADPVAGGASVTITGTGFVAGATVVTGQGNGRFAGTISATSVTVVSPTEITATAGGGAKAGTFKLRDDGGGHQRRHRWRQLHVPLNVRRYGP